MNRRAIVVYLDFEPDQLKMFKMLVQSLVEIDVVDTDLIVFFNPWYNNDTTFEDGFITDNCKVKFLEAKDLKYSKEFFGYKYINSIACINGQDWLLDYEFILRTDTDTLLTEKWNTYYPENFTVGAGSYVNDVDTTEKLKAVAEKNGLTRKSSYQQNLGSTWYGKSDDVLKVASLTTSLVSYLLNNDFKSFDGEWPGYYKGVTLLYASEIALNHVLDTIVKDPVNFDFHSTSSDSVINHVHIHCWHTSESFSKLAFVADEYNHINIEDLDRSIISDYCMYCAIVGNNDE